MPHIRLRLDGPSVALNRALGVNAGEFVPSVDFLKPAEFEERRISVFADGGASVETGRGARTMGLINTGDSLSSGGMFFFELDLLFT